MRKLKRSCAILAVTALLSSGCAAVTQKTLDTFSIPERPVLDPVPSGTTITLTENHFVDLTKYVIELEGQLDKCNAQAEVFNGAR